MGGKRNHGGVAGDVVAAPPCSAFSPHIPPFHRKSARLAPMLTPPSPVFSCCAKSAAHVRRFDVISVRGRFPKRLGTHQKTAFPQIFACFLQFYKIHTKIGCERGRLASASRWSRRQPGREGKKRESTKRSLEAWRHNFSL